MTGISCICLTYGRSWLLAEAIEAYLRQDYAGPMELIVLNDFEGITLTAEIDKGSSLHRDIKITNLPHRMSSLNDKFDLGVKLAQYPLICMWDDDDISLPHRLTQAARAWHGLDKPDYVGMAWHYNMDVGQKPRFIKQGLHGGDVFTREAYFAMGGSQGAGHNDENFVAKIKTDGNYKEYDNEIAPAYIYRWGGITGHNSCYARDLKTCMKSFHRDVVNDPRFKLGRLRVVPAWSEDYVGLCK